VALVKYWLHIDPAEQLRRFKEREKIGYKQFKITEEDYRNREKMPQYIVAVDEMIERTSTHYAPWTLVEANDKDYARIKVLKAYCAGSRPLCAARGKWDKGGVWLVIQG